MCFLIIDKIWLLVDNYILNKIDFLQTRFYPVIFIYFQLTSRIKTNFGTTDNRNDFDYKKLYLIASFISTISH